MRDENTHLLQFDYGVRDGNYAEAYGDNTDSDSDLFRTRSDAYMAGYVLGFYDTYEVCEVPTVDQRVFQWAFKYATDRGLVG